jgi:cellulose synthase/poly-beta-1,6-N-acetylglucosamine synthase-like glycosyltransferase
MSAFPLMIVVRTLQWLLGLVGLFWTLYVFAMPLAAKFRPGRATISPVSRVHPSIAVIIPAHDMEEVIGDCVAAISASQYPMDRVTIYVVADNCTDQTAARAREAGAIVLDRGASPAGKTYALAWTFEALAHMGVDSDAYVVTDATARVHRDFLNALTHPTFADEDVVVGHSVLAGEDQPWFAKCLGLTLVHRNFQNWARQRLGLSSLIEGRGMAYSRRYIRQYGWSLAVPTHSRAGRHPTEDWRHGVRIVEQGLRVAYADDAIVFTPLRASLGAATRQGIRWERGRQLNAITHGLTLLGAAIRSRSRVTLFAALDAIQPPVAILGVYCVGLALLAFAVPAGFWLNALGVAPLVLMTCYGIQVTIRGRNDGISPTTVIWAPIYLLWRLASFVLAWTSLDRARPPRSRSSP